MKKSFIFLLFLALFCLNVNARTINDAQIISSDSHIYKDFQKLQNAARLLGFTQNTPLSVGELKFYLRQFDYDSLDENTRNIYDYLYDFLYSPDDIIPLEDFELSIHPQVNFEGYYKTDKDIPWSFDYYFKDNLISMPLDIGFGKNFAMGINPFLGMSKIAAAKSDNFCNIPVNLKKPADSYKSIEFYFPTFAYAGLGKYKENWGYNLFISKQGKTIGNTQTGSIIYNSTFETDAFAEFDIYSKIMKFTMDVVQISSNRMDNIQQDNTERYLYYHQFDVRIFKNFKLSVMEGSLIASPFSIRFLNPMPPMHQFGGWKNYITEENKEIYGETNFCADFAFMFEYIPVYNLRLYGMYNQIEMQLPWERSGEWGRYDPNSIGFQGGLEYSIFLDDYNSINIAGEAFYNSPYMYIKQTPSASLYRVRRDMQTGSSIYSWIGSPYGPDSAGGIIKFVYDANKKWKAELSYTVISKGQLDFSIFKENEYGYYEYYPSVCYKLKEAGKTNTKLTNDDLYNIALDMELSGIPQISHQIKLNGSYLINESFELNGQLTYNYINNFKHIKNQPKQGLELAAALTYKIF